MPWKVDSFMSVRQEFVQFAGLPEANVSALCRRFGISRKTGYKWLARSRQGSALSDRSRRPHDSPARTPAAVEQLVVDLRLLHPAWGGRKLRRRLLDLKHPVVPAVSVIHAILKRHGLIDAKESDKHRAFERFERAEPNDLWQIDFKGHFAIETGRCHPLTMLDDHSRYNLLLKACGDERTMTVKTALIASFERYGNAALSAGRQRRAVGQLSK